MNWIEDKLPKKYIPVLATDEREYFVAWVTDNTEWESYDTMFEGSVKAWMPIPEY